MSRTARASRREEIAVERTCQRCGASWTIPRIEIQQPSWCCPACSAWNSDTIRMLPQATSRAELISEVATEGTLAVPTGISELDRVLGGGVVLGGIILVGGDPGVGKSTLLMQALAALSRKGHRALYVSAEESKGQVALRSKRLGTSDRGELFLLAESELERGLEVVREMRPKILVVDSVQAMRSSEIGGTAGTVTQVREVAQRFNEIGKQNEIAVFLVGHVTKDGMLAGPKVVEHLVDTVLAFEGEHGHALRTLRAQKNRFGSATEVGVFEMTQKGVKELANPSTLLLAERPKGTSGSVVCATTAGTRSLLVEIQALVLEKVSGAPKRVASGCDAARLAMVLAVLEKKAGLCLSESDVYVSVAGGVRADEPAVDLALALAVASSLAECPFPNDAVVFGEVGLSGEIRGVDRTEARLQEALAMGFKKVLCPRSTQGKGKHVERVANLADALARGGLTP